MTLPHRRPPTSLLLASVVVVVTVASGGCGAPSTDAGPAPAPPTVSAALSAPTAPTAPTTGRAPTTDAEAGTVAAPTGRDDGPAREALDPGDGYALTVGGPQVEVYDEPQGTVAHRLDNPRATGAPLTFLLAGDTGRGWYEVMVPVRPNGTTGFVRAQDVTVARLPYRLEMSVADNELTLLEGDEVLRSMPAASGTGDTPTPRGLFYLTELLEPTNRGYGPYAYGLSGFSEVLDSFGGGPGQIGLHGTDDDASVGRAVSAGCIRLSDEDITYLAGLLPLGTPIEIR